MLRATEKLQVFWATGEAKALVGCLKFQYFAI